MQEPRTAEPVRTAPTFVAELSERVQQTRSTIDSAAAAGDDDLAEAHLGELHSLIVLAAAHDLALPDTMAYLADRGAPLVLGSDANGHQQRASA
ncbi:MAG: hypothetical protein ACRYF3_02625 [Janthinobacterium lividum]